MTKDIEMNGFTKGSRSMTMVLNSHSKAYFNVEEALQKDGVKVDMVSIQINNNWGNKIFTTRKAANELYKAVNGKTIQINSLSDMCSFIKDVAKEEYSIGRYLDEFYCGGGK